MSVKKFGWRFGINSGVSFTPPKNPWLKKTGNTGK